MELGLRTNNKPHKIIMVGPALEGLGGISRVAKTWQESSFFSDFNVEYIPSVTDEPVNRFIFLIMGLVDYTLSLITGCLVVYIHTSSYNSFRRKSLFILLALILRTKILLHIHPSHFYHFLSNCSFFERKITYFLLNRIDLFVVLTKEMEQNIQNLFPNKPRIVLRNPVNVEKMKNSGNYVRLTDRLLYLGWYIKEKGVYELVDAIEVLLKKGVRVQIDFFGTKKTEELRRYVEGKGLKEQIRINGWINNSNKLKALYKSTALILPTHSEGIPNVILEAMATKTPIIATLVGGLREILRDGENAIIAEVNNPQNLSNKILECLEDKQLREKIATTAYQEVCMHYDVKVIKQGFGGIVKRFSAQNCKGSSLNQ